MIHLSIHNFALFHFVNIFFVVFRWFGVLFLWNLVLHWWSYTKFLRTAILENPRDMGRRSWKRRTFLRTNYLFGAESSCFCRHEILLSTTSTCFCRIQITFCATSNFLFPHKMSFLFRTSLWMLCHGDIFLFSHSNKNIITCQKINKLSFLCGTKKIISFCLHHHFFIFSFYITHCQHVDLLRSGPGNKETFNHLLLTCLIYTEAVTK